MKKILFFTLFASIVPCQLFGAQQELKKEVAEHVIAPGGPGSFVLGIPGLTTPINPKPDMKAIEQAKQNRAKLGTKAARVDILLTKAINSQEKIEEGLLKNITEILSLGANLPNEEAFIDSFVSLGVKSNINDFAKLLNIAAKYGFNFDESLTKIIEAFFISKSRENLLSSLLPLVLAFVSDPNKPNERYYTALSKIALHPKAQKDGLIKLLVERGANINGHPSADETPLMIASRNNDPSNAQELMRYEANPLFVNKHNKNALQILDARIFKLQEGKHQEESIIKLREFRPELEKYTKEYRQKHAKEVAEAIPELNPNLIDMIINSLVGEKTPQEKALQ